MFSVIRMRSSDRLLQARGYQYKQGGQEARYVMILHLYCDYPLLAQSKTSAKGIWEHIKMVFQWPDIVSTCINSILWPRLSWRWYFLSRTESTQLELSSNRIAMTQSALIEDVSDLRNLIQSRSLILLRFCDTWAEKNSKEEQQVPIKPLQSFPSISTWIQ